ncbi:MAG: hypothetical protein EU535_01780 [Promethearchaeota archaeon]|nr:MAG: hypothetical protein EU535_01780 [Candidatus Lokiarchaeota archaeon]
MKLEEFPSEENLKRDLIMKKYYKPDFSILFNKIKEINTPIKNDLLIALLDGEWHSETELIRLAKKLGTVYVGAVTLGTMVNSLNNMLKNNYLEKQFFNGEMYYKISDNYVGLTRAAYNKSMESLRY